MSSQTPPAPPVFQFREFDPALLSEEIAREASRVRETVEQYERAKMVSQRVLEAQVCV